MSENETERSLREAEGRARAVLRSAADVQLTEQNHRKMLLHTLLDAVLCAGGQEAGVCLTVMNGAAYVTVPGRDALPENGGRTALQLATLLLAFCHATGEASCPRDS